MIKLLMSLGCDRNDAARAATLADGNLPHTVVYYDLLEEFIRTYYEQLDKTVVEGDMTGAVSGMLGSHLYGRILYRKAAGGPFGQGVFDGSCVLFAQKRRVHPLSLRASNEPHDRRQAGAAACALRV